MMQAIKRWWNRPPTWGMDPSYKLTTPEMPAAKVKNLEVQIKKFHRKADEWEDGAKIWIQIPILNIGFDLYWGKALLLPIPPLTLASFVYWFWNMGGLS